MELLRFIPLYVVTVTTVAGRRNMSELDARYLTFQNMRNFTKDSREGPIMCARLAKEPYFVAEMLLGHTWRIYYTWNLDLQKQCLDMTFQKVTPEIINRMPYYMRDYLKPKPHYDAASLLVGMDRTMREMVLFADQRSAGRFQGLPNLIEAENSPELASMPLPNFHLKLMYGGRFLLMADCLIGVTTLSAHSTNIPYRAEITNIVKNIEFGPGRHACISYRNNDEKTEYVDKK